MPDEVQQHDFDVVVVGAGPAGLAAAATAAERGRRVALIEGTPWLGGQIWRGEESSPTSATARRWLVRLQRSGAQVFRSTTVFAAPAARVLLAERGADVHVRGAAPAGAGSERSARPGGGPEGSRPDALALIWRKLILATGARELFLPFPGWTLPGVVGAGGLSALVKGGLSVRGKRVVVAGSGPLLIAVAAELRRHGALVACIVEQASLASLLKFGVGLPWLAPAKLAQAIRFQATLLGVRFRTHCWPVQALGQDRIEAVELTDGTKQWTQPCDYLACGFGLIPNLELPQLLGCRVGNGVVQADQLQKTTAPDVFCAGEPTGIGGAERALLEGQVAGLVAAGREAEASSLLAARARQHRFADALARAFTLRPELRGLPRPDTIVCRCEDVLRAALEACAGWPEAKLHTRCGMGPCQGRVCGGATRFLFGWDNASIRPPVLPVPVGALCWSMAVPQGSAPASGAVAGACAPHTHL